ncbi:MAG: phosphoenolpyruvate-protein phosphotransferase PtsP, partial [Balneolaceae bacterium]|nr:phosphoenolpyruvate-protein phosphotransferase PtsP [Balneolaceae bacterium]
PSTALMAGQLSAEVDFFSIGTNDLTQYTLAADRGNEKISGLFDPFHPAVWKLIRMTAEGAAVNRIPVSVCGEMASNPAAAACLFGMGIRDLSMTTNAIPRVKEMLCSNTSTDMKSLAEKVLQADRVFEVHEHLELFSRSV